MDEERRSGRPLLEAPRATELTCVCKAMSSSGRESTIRMRSPIDRVSALSFLPQSLLMPITYALLTPLALLTLDSASWETRGQPSAVAGASH